MEAADEYLCAAQTMVNLDDQSRAGLIFLATVAIKRADTQTASPDDPISSDLSTFDDRVLTYSTIRTKISGVRKVRTYDDY